MDTNKIIRAIGAPYGNDNPQELTDALRKGDIVAEVFPDGSISVSESPFDYDYPLVVTATYLIHRPVNLPTARGSVIQASRGHVYVLGSEYWSSETGNERSEKYMKDILAGGGKILFDAGDVK